MRTAPVRGPASWLALALIALAPLAARAAGVEIPENGALPLARGGTAVSSFGDAYSLEFNPAGMASIDGLDVRLDAREIDNAVTFQRAPGTDGTVFDKVSNSAGADLEPSLQVAYRLRHILQGRLAFGLGIWGPPGVLHYKYPNPLTLAQQCTSCSRQVGAESPQRYSLIDSYMLIVYPSVGVAFRVTRQLAVGLTLQDVIANIDFHEAIAAVSIPGAGEDPDLDAIVHMSVHQSSGLTGILGVAYEPIPKLHLGLSFRPQIVIKADGVLNVALPAAAKQFGYKMSGNQATFEFALPPVAHLGATYLFNHRLNVSAEAVWEGWSVVKTQSLTPHDVAVDEGATTVPVAPMSIQRHWMDTYGGRIGATYTVLEWTPHHPLLDVSIGGLYETNAVPSSYQAVDFVNGNRYAGSLGLTFHWQGFALTASAMYYPQVDVNISDSAVARAAPTPENPPDIVGNGAYTTSTWIGAVGLAYSGLGGR